MFSHKSYITEDQRIIFYYDNEIQQTKTIVFLHGWGADKDNLQRVYRPLESDYRIISLDLPGFGESTCPTSSWNSMDYARDIANFLDRIGVNNYSLVGHSFGGKIATLITYLYPKRINKLILIAASVLRNRHGIQWYFQVYSFKLMKLFFRFFLKKRELPESVKNRTGSDDYRAASGQLRNILIKVVNEDFSKLLPLIQKPVFLYWGEKDLDTPLWMAKKINRLVKDSGLFVVKNGTHYPFLQDNRIVAIIRSFLSD